MEKHSVSRLIGAPPGYVGYDQGGQLIERIRKQPYTVLLLDEIEKAHMDVFDILLQVMDHATLTDNQGREADFRHVTLIMTSNAGAREMAARGIGFGSGPAGDGRKEIERLFSPEFRNRLDEIVTFARWARRSWSGWSTSSPPRSRSSCASARSPSRSRPRPALAGEEGLRPRSSARAPWPGDPDRAQGSPGRRRALRRARTRAGRWRSTSATTTAWSSASANQTDPPSFRDQPPPRERAREPGRAHSVVEHQHVPDPDQVALKHHGEERRPAARAGPSCRGRRRRTA